LSGDQELAWPASDGGAPTKAQPLILVVDDDAGILRLVQLDLSSEGFNVVTASGGAEAIALADQCDPDLVLLDIMMPGMSGLETMRVLRERRDVPIILLTARGAEPDRISGLDQGADDYVTKPFSPEELAARIRAVLRRTEGRGESVVRVGALEVDLARRLVRRDGKVVVLTRTEWLLLQQLARSAGTPVPNAELLGNVWGPEYCQDLQYLRVWVSRLRRKIEDDQSAPRYVRTLPGVGYMLASEGVPPVVAREPASEAAAAE
jgi:DNA-binding response OmpR family regulator